MATTLRASNFTSLGIDLPLATNDQRRVSHLLGSPLQNGCNSTEEAPRSLESAGGKVHGKATLALVARKAHRGQYSLGVRASVDGLLIITL